MNSGNFLNKEETAIPKSLSSAVLGVPKSHGVKLSLMTSEDKKEFMQKLEEWRKNRREKLAAKILAKQKVVEKPKLFMNPPLAKPRPVVPPSGESLKSQNRESVFERLYKGNGKFNKPEVNDPKRIVKKPVSKTLKESDINALKDEKLEASKCDIGESLNNLFSISDDADSGIQTVEEAKNVTCKEDKLPEQKSESNTEAKVNNTLKLTKPKPYKTNVPLRRSLSMLFRQKARAVNIKRSLSEKSIHELDAIDINPKSEMKAKSVTFALPKNKESSSAHLRSKLENWLKTNGHSLDGYRHLRCFGVDNIKSDQPPKKSIAFETPSKAEESDKENVTPPPVVPQVDVENWLKELCVLITKMKYPPDRCEEWLAAIRKKYPKCSQLPIYWECLAALNESKGDIKSAIEDYERAIINGGQVESVGNSLAQLFDKMVIEQKKPTKTKIERGIDPKNIFKSTIIKFALQQKTLKRLEPKFSPSVREQLYIATPVRRSSRLQTPLKSKEVNSLETLTPEVKKNLTFKPNESLLEAD